MAADSTPEEEVRRLERHYSVNPEGLVFARLADAYRRCGRLERSLELLREGLERHPDYTTGHLIQGRTLREAGRPEEAAASFRRVLGLDAGNLVALRSLAELAAERGDMDEAHRWTDRLEKADPFTNFNPAEVAARARQSDGEQSGGEAPVEEVGREPEVEAGTDAREPGESRPGGGERELSPPVPDPADAAATPELPGEDGLASEIAAMADEQWWSSEEEPSAADDTGEDSDVATETMAHLYAQQGLYEEAADVYRRLLERRPEDDELRRRLDEVTRRAGGGEEVAMEAEEPEPAGSQPDAGVPPPAEGTVSSGEDDAGPAPEVSAGEHFRALLRGKARPSAGGGAAG